MMNPGQSGFVVFSLNSNRELSEKIARCSLFAIRLSRVKFVVLKLVFFSKGEITIQGLVLLFHIWISLILRPGHMQMNTFYTVSSTEPLAVNSAVCFLLYLFPGSLESSLLRVM